MRFSGLEVPHPNMADLIHQFDDSYRQIRKIEALNGLKGDLHEFTVTRDDTALLSVYEQIPADLGYYERQPDGWIWDCHFQEVDLETNQLRFSWRASEHFRFQDTFNDVRGDAGAEHNAFDWFHINSVQKDDRGNYIVSARYSHAVSYIDGKTGDILWHLGGKNNSFQDLSGGNATNFAWQHDARWHDDYTTISIFDNAAYFGDDTHPARGMKVKVDTNAMTAELMQEYRHPGGYISESQGSMQVLDGGNVFLGYGSAPAFTEFSPDGRVLCDVSFGALHWREDGSFSPGAVMSYRAYKADWTGRPSENPKVKFQDGTFYVSWNGATEVRTWKLQGRSVANPQALKSDWRDVGSCDWQGFESSMKVETDTTEPQAHLSYRLSASDGQNKTLGIWEVQTDGTVTVHAPREPSASNTAGYAFVAFASAVIGFLIYRCKGNRGILARQRPTPALGVMGTTIALFQRLISPGDHKQNGWAWSRQARRKDRMSPKSPSMENLRLELRSSEDEGEELEGRVDGVRRRSPVRSWVV